MAALPGSVATDQCIITGPHCHAPVHPAGTAPPITVPHGPSPMVLSLAFAPTVMCCNLPALTKNSMTAPMPCCIPAPTPCVPPVGTAMVNTGSSSVKICSQDAARITDPTKHIPCDSGAVPSSGGKIVGPGAATVMIA
jgi:hypothetical protein